MLQDKSLSVKPVEELLLENLGILFDAVDISKAYKMCYTSIAKTSALPINNGSCFLDKESLTNDKDWMERMEKNLIMLCANCKP